MKNLHVLALLCFLGVACATFPGNELAQQSPEGLSSHDVTVLYDAEWYSPQGLEYEHGRKLLSSSVRKILHSSGMFSTVTYGSGEGDYQLEFMMRNHGNLGLAGLSGFITGLTLFVIPGYARDGYSLTVDVTSATEKRQYRYQDHVSTWFHLFLVFALGRPDFDEVSEQVRENMLWSFLHDFDRDMLAGSLARTPVH